jgi:hypothetical protein
MKQKVSPRMMSLASAGLVSFYPSPVRIYAVVSDETEKAVETFGRREDAERFLEKVRGDDPALAELLRLEPVELDA